MAAEREDARVAERAAVDKAAREAEVTAGKVVEVGNTMYTGTE